MGLNNNEQMAPFHARDPHVPRDPQVLESLGKQEVKVGSNGRSLFEVPY